MKVRVDRFEFVEDLMELGFSHDASHVLYEYYELNDDDEFDYKNVRRLFREFIVEDLVDSFRLEWEEFKEDYDIIMANLNDDDIFDFVEYLHMKPIHIWYNENENELGKGNILVKLQ